MLLLLFVATLYGKDNAMTIYGNVNADMDIWFTTKFKATKNQDKECTKTLNYFYKKDKKIPAFKFKTVEVTPDKNGDYRVQIPLEVEDVKCAYEVVDVVLYVGKKGYGDIGNRIDNSLNAVYIYAPNTNENYFRTKYGLVYGKTGISQGGFYKNIEKNITNGNKKNALWKLSENEYYIIAPESRYECQYRKYKRNGKTKIRCIMKIVKGEVGRVEPIDKNTTLKIDIVLNDTDRDGNKYDPKKDYEEYKNSKRNPDNWSIFKKIKYKILGD